MCMCELVCVYIIMYVCVCVFCVYVLLFVCLCVSANVDVVCVCMCSGFVHVHVCVWRERERNRVLNLTFLSGNLQLFTLLIQFYYICNISIRGKRMQRSYSDLRDLIFLRKLTIEDPSSFNHVCIA